MLQKTISYLLVIPYGLAMTIIGDGLAMIEEHSEEAMYLEEAVVAFQAALRQRTREQVPLSWAATQYSLGYVLTSLEERESGTARLEEAVEAYQTALQEYRVAGATDVIERVEWDLQECEALLARRRKP